MNELYAQTVALTLTVLPGANALPSVVVTTRRSFDSSEWKVAEVPSAQALLMLFGWFGSAPPDNVSRPRMSEGPESHPDVTFTHFGALSVES